MDETLTVLQVEEQVGCPVYLRVTAYEDPAWEPVPTWSEQSPNGGGQNKHTKKILRTAHALAYGLHADDNLFNRRRGSTGRNPRGRVARKLLS